MAGRSQEFPLRLKLQAVDRATQPIRRVNDRINRTLAPVRRLSQNMRRMARDSGLPRVAAGFGRVAREAGRVGLRLGAITAAAGLGTRALMGQVEQLDSLGDTAARIGLTVDELAQLRFAAEQSGASANVLDGSIESFNRRIGQAREGTGSLHSQLEETHPELLRQVKTAENTEEAFLLMSEAIREAEDAQERGRIAQAAFSAQGRQLIPMLQRGGDEIRGLMREYESLAGSQDDAVEGASDVRASMARVSAVLDGVRSTIVEALAPAVQSIAGDIQEFFQENREAIEAWAQDFGEKLPDRIESLKESLGALIDFIRPVWDAIGGARGAAIALAAAISGKLIIAIHALSTALLTTPVGWIMTAIGLIVGGAVALVRHWDTVRDFFVGFFKTVGEEFQAFWDWLKDLPLIGGVIEMIESAWGPVRDFFGWLWDGIKEAFEAGWRVVSAIVDRIRDAVGWVREAIEWLRDSERKEARQEQIMEAAAQDPAMARRLNIDPEAAQREMARRGGGDARAERIMGGVREGMERSRRGEINVRFENTPRDVRVDKQRDDGDMIDLETGFAGLRP